MGCKKMKMLFLIQPVHPGKSLSLNVLNFFITFNKNGNEKKRIQNSG